MKIFSEILEQIKTRPGPGQNIIVSGVFPGDAFYDDLVKAAGPDSRIVPLEIFLEETMTRPQVDVFLDMGTDTEDQRLDRLLSVWPHFKEGFQALLVGPGGYSENLGKWFPKCRVESRKQGLISMTGMTFMSWLTKSLGYAPDYYNPTTYNEKINFKKIHDRNPALQIAADKYISRFFVQDILGTDKVLKPLLYVTDRPEDIPFKSLPPDYVIKPNHLSGAFRFIRNGKVNQAPMIALCKKWLAKKYAPHALEWAYIQIPPKIMIENLLDNHPESFKFHMFQGECVFIQVNGGGVEDKKLRYLSFYDPDWKHIPLTWDGYPFRPVARPPQVDEMLDHAKKLSWFFDYVRVDFCLSGGRVFYEELTNYPTGGHSTLKPKSFDLELGMKWPINREYWHDKKFNFDKLFHRKA